MLRQRARSCAHITSRLGSTSSRASNKSAPRRRSMSCCTSTATCCSFSGDYRRRTRDAQSHGRAKEKLHPNGQHHRFVEKFFAIFLLRAGHAQVPVNHCRKRAPCPGGNEYAVTLPPWVHQRWRSRRASSYVVNLDSVRAPARRLATFRTADFFVGPMTCKVIVRGWARRGHRGKARAIGISLSNPLFTCDASSSSFYYRCWDFSSA